MAPQMSVRALPGHRRMPSRLLVLLTGGLALLTLCFFTSHLPVLRHFTSARLEGNSWMTSPGQSAAPPHQHHHHQGPSAVQVLLDLIEREKAKLLEQLPMEYGASKHPSFKDDPPLLIGDLPPEHIPTYTPPSPFRNSGKGEDVRTHGKRLVIVGDVHGHRVALETLLRKIDFDHRRGDHLVLAGDIVTKGPDSKGVVQLAMDIGASAVRGNQDDKVLAAAREMHWFSAVDDESRLGAEVDDGDDDEEGVVKEKGAAAGEAKMPTIWKSHAHQVARSLTRSQLAWIRSHPLILRIGHIPDATAAPWNASMLLVVHGGLVPGVPLEKQDPWAVMNMRSLLYPRKGKGKKKKGGNKHAQQSEQEPRLESMSDETETDIEEANVAVVVPIDRHNGEPWSHAWNRYQNTLPPTAPRTVAIYGHDAKVGLQVDPIVDISPNSHSSSSSKKKKNKHKDKEKMEGDKVEEKKEEEADGEEGEEEENKDSKHHDRIVGEDKSEVDEANKKEKGLRYAFGLDSGCGNMKQLTALILEAGADGIHHKIEQVDCAKLVGVTYFEDQQ